MRRFRLGVAAERFAQPQRHAGVAGNQQIGPISRNEAARQRIGRDVDDLASLRGP
jgi:hypothetical protein